MTTDKRRQREFIVGAVLEFVGIVALAFRFGPKIGGPALLLIGGAIFVIGLGLQIRALLSSHKRN